MPDCSPLLLYGLYDSNGRLFFDFLLSRELNFYLESSVRLSVRMSGPLRVKTFL